MRFEFSLGVYVRDLVVMLLCVFEGSLITMKRFKRLGRGFDAAQMMGMNEMSGIVSVHMTSLLVDISIEVVAAVEGCVRVGLCRG